MTVLIAQSLYGPLTYVDPNDPSSTVLPSAQIYEFKPKTDACLITLGGSASSATPPLFTGVKPILNGQSLLWKMGGGVITYTSSEEHNLRQKYAGQAQNDLQDLLISSFEKSIVSARVFDNGSPDRNSLVPVSVEVNQDSGLLLDAKNVLWVVPLDMQTLTSEDDIFSLTVTDVGKKKR